MPRPYREPIYQSQVKAEVKSKHRQGSDCNSISALLPDKMARPKKMEYFDEFEAAVAEGKKSVGIYCEYSPRELVLAADAIPEYERTRLS